MDAESAFGLAASVAPLLRQKRKAGWTVEQQMDLLRQRWLADALHVRMSAATNPNQWREFRKDPEGVPKESEGVPRELRGISKGSARDFQGASKGLQSASYKAKDEVQVTSTGSPRDLPLTS